MSSGPISDGERVKELTWRLERLDNFLGHPQKKNIRELINGLEEEIVHYASRNSNARNLVNKADQIQRLTSTDFQRSLMADRATKLELILADEQRIRHITKCLTDIDQMAQVLNENSFEDIPKLSSSLHQLLVNHHTLKNDYDQFNEQLTSFVQAYAAFILSMDETLQQYRTILNKHQDQSMDELQSE